MTSPHSTAETLFHAWQQKGDERARTELVERYTALANRLARRYHGAHEPLDDLRQVAMVGLLKAIDRYDPDRGSDFQAFAVPTILGELKRYFRDCCWSVHMPRGIQDLALKVEQAQRTLTTMNGRAPSYSQLAEYLELSQEDVLDALEATTAHHAISLDSPYESTDGELGTLGDAIGEIDQRFELVDCGTSIQQAAQTLTENERRVLALRFIEDRTQSQISEEIGVSQMQVSRILRSTLDRLSAVVDASPDRGR